MKLSQLKNLVAVAEAGSVRQASRDLHISQSAVTKSIKLLEAELGVKLFHRFSHGVAPTASGKALIARANIIEGELRKARIDIDFLENAKAGDLKVSASPTVAMNLLPRAILNFNRARPNVKIHVEEGVYPDVLPAIRSGKLDLAVCLLPEPPADGELDFEVLLKDEVTPAVRLNHPLTEEKNLSLEDLLDKDWIVFGQRHSRRHVYEQTFRLNGLTPPASSIDCSSFICALTLVENSDYIALVPKQIFVGRKKGWPIVPLSLKVPMQPWTVAVISRSQKTLSPAALEFLSELRRQVPAADTFAT